MFLGTGSPVAKLYDAAGVRVATLLLPHPMLRELGPFDDVFTVIDTDARGTQQAVFEGFRFHQRLIWTSHAQNQTDVAKLRQLASWRRDGCVIKFRPYADNPGCTYDCDLVTQKMPPDGGKVQADEITIELLARELVTEIPGISRDGLSMRRGFVSLGTVPDWTTP